jgi:hypothetical protein
MRTWPIAVTLSTALALAGCSDAFNAIKGEKGDAGEKGEAGPPGPAGPAGTGGTVIRFVEGECRQPCKVACEDNERILSTFAINPRHLHLQADNQATFRRSDRMLQPTSSSPAFPAGRAALVRRSAAPGCRAAGGNAAVGGPEMGRLGHRAGLEPVARRTRQRLNLPRFGMPIFLPGPPLMRVVAISVLAILLACSSDRVERIAPAGHTPARPALVRRAEPRRIEPTGR